MPSNFIRPRTLQRRIEKSLSELYDERTNYLFVRNFLNRAMHEIIREQAASCNIVLEGRDEMIRYLDEVYTLSAQGGELECSLIGMLLHLIEQNYGKGLYGVAKETLTYFNVSALFIMEQTFDYKAKLLTLAEQ